MFVRPAVRAFACGFAGSFAGGLIYVLVLTSVYPAGLEFAWLRVIGVSLGFGGFEMWRRARPKHKRDNAPQRERTQLPAWPKQRLLGLLEVFEKGERK